MIVTFGLGRGLTPGALAVRGMTRTSGTVQPQPQERQIDYRGHGRRALQPAFPMQDSEEIHRQVHELHEARLRAVEPEPAMQERVASLPVAAAAPKPDAAREAVKGIGVDAGSEELWHAAVAVAALELDDFL